MRSLLGWPRLVFPLLLVVPAGCTKKSEAATTAPCLVQVPTQLDPANKRADARRLLELTGATELAQQLVDPLLESFRKSMTGVPPEFWDKIRERFKMSDLTETIVDIYVEELSHEDIAALVAFYESPNGQRFTAALPTITSKSQEAGRIYGEKMAREVVQEIIDAGYMQQPPPG